MPKQMAPWFLEIKRRNGWTYRPGEQGERGDQRRERRQWWRPTESGGEERRRRKAAKRGEKFSGARAGRLEIRILKRISEE